MPTGFARLQVAAANIVALTFYLAVALGVVVTGFYSLTTHGAFQAAVLLSLMLGWLGLIWHFRDQFGATVSRLFRWTCGLSLYRWVFICTLLGLFLRIVIGFLLHGQPQSDFLEYFTLAKRLAFEGRYYSEDALALWAPGLPLFLSIFLFVFGDHAWIPLAACAVLFLLSISAVAYLAEMQFGEFAARLSVLLIAIWPTAVLMSWYATKELLVLPLITGSLLFYFAGRRRRSLALTALSGACGGYAALVYPALLLSPLIYAVDEVFAAARFRRVVSRLVVFSLLFFAVITPWTVRNYLALGHFIPISTTGGITLYMTNNPEATGQSMPLEWQRFGDDEITRERNARRAAIDWIIHNPDRFLLLSFKRLTYFLSGDDVGAFWALEKGMGWSPVAYGTVYALCDVFWIAALSLVLVGCTSQHRTFPDCERGDVAMMLYFLYGATADTIFEGHGNHHIGFYGILACFAALTALAPAASQWLASDARQTEGTIASRDGN
jgi:hypothetical protein